MTDLPAVKLANVLRVVNVGGHHPHRRLYIDGELFAWATMGGFTVHSASHTSPHGTGVELTIAAMRVEVVGDTDDAAPPAQRRGVTSDPTDPRLTHGSDPVDGGPVDQAATYLVLSDEERGRGFVRPVRLSYWHTRCGSVTTMSRQIAETYAAQPGFYWATYCATCRQHRPVGADGEFHWVDPRRPDHRGPADPKVGT